MAMPGSASLQHSRAAVAASHRRSVASICSQCYLFNYHHAVNPYDPRDHLRGIGADVPQGVRIHELGNANGDSFEQYFAALKICRLVAQCRRRRLDVACPDPLWCQLSAHVNPFVRFSLRFYAAPLYRVRGHCRRTEV